MFRHSKFGLAALILSAAAALATSARAEDPPAKLPEVAFDTSPDKKLSVAVGNGVMTVAKVSVEKIAVTTTEGTVEKEVLVNKQAYTRGDDKEKYLAAKFVPGKAAKVALIAVSDTTIYAMDGASGDLLWTVKHGSEADKAVITFKGEELKVTMGGKIRRFDSKTGKELGD